MSEYYDLNKVYSIQNFNKLIEDVNEILENPPPDTDCEPIEPIEEAKSPHILTIKNFEEIRDKLEETCPDIEFEVDLKMWNREIIDEIEEQMELAWCDCITEPVEEIYGPFTYSWELVFASPSAVNCCGNITEHGTSYLCPGMHYYEIEWFGPHYSPVYDSNVPIYRSIYDTYKEATEQQTKFIFAFDKMLRCRLKMIEYQDKVDHEVGLVDSFIKEYDNMDCPGDELCDYIKEKICKHGKKAREHQDRLDLYYDKFEEEHTKKVDSEVAVEVAATANWAAVLSLDTRFPCDKNLIADCIGELFIDGSFGDLGWVKWFNPKYDKRVQDVLSGIRIWQKNPQISGDMIFKRYWISITPKGQPYISQNKAKKYQQVFGKPYYERRIRYRDESWGSDCEMLDWEDIKTRYWEGGDRSPWMPSWYPAHVWEPLPPHEPDKYGAIEVYGEIIRLPGRKDTDFTEEQEKIWNECLNWYVGYEDFEGYPQYDDRHEKYC